MRNGAVVKNNSGWAAGLAVALMGLPYVGEVSAQEVDLPATTATGQRQAAGYRARESSVATRTDADLMEIPFAVSSVNTELMRTVAAGRGDDLYDWVAGPEQSAEP